MTDVANPVAGDSEYALILQSNVMQLSMGGMDMAPGEALTHILCDCALSAPHMQHGLTVQACAPVVCVYSMCVDTESNVTQ